MELRQRYTRKTMSNAVKRRSRPQAQGDQEGGYSGRLLLRMPPMLHSELARLAEDREVSLNQLITKVLGDAVWGAGPAPSEAPDAPSPRLTRIALVVNLAVVAFAGVLAVGLLVVALSGAV
jgi:hypothetical protein